LVTVSHVRTSCRHLYLRFLTDPDFDDVPNDRIEEVKSAFLKNTYKKYLRDQLAKERLTYSEELCTLHEVLELRDTEAEEMKQHAEPDPPSLPSLDHDPTISCSQSIGQPLEVITSDSDGFFQELKSAYKTHALYQKVLSHPESHHSFKLSGDYFARLNHAGETVLCIPKHLHLTTKQSLRGMILQSAHQILGHLGAQRTADYIRRWYWWPRIFADTELFCRSCKECQTCKPFNHAPYGKLHSLPISERPWES
jgi:hypothetical protein